MAFTLPKTFNQLLGLAPESTPNKIIKEQDMPKHIYGYSDMNEVMYINSKLPKNKRKQVIAHESVHIEQINSGKLRFDDNGNYIWKGKKVKMTEKGTYNKKLPWEVKAYMASNKVKNGSKRRRN